MWVCLVGSYDDCGHGGEKLGRRRGSVNKGATAAGRKRAREEGEQTQNLTVEATGWSAGSGTSRRRQTGAGDLGD